MPDEPPLVPAPPPPDFEHILTPEQVAQIGAELKNIIVAARFVVPLIVAWREHGISGLVGELHAALGSLQLTRQS